MKMRDYNQLTGTCNPLDASAIVHSIMDITPLVPVGRQLITSYGDGGFRVSGVFFTGPVIILPDRTLSWPVPSFADLTLEALALIVEAAPRILILGTGPRQELIPPPLRRALREAGIVIEAMDTGAACRTYNVLLTEERSVAAALLPA